MEETSEKSKIMALLERNWKWLVVSGLVVLGGSLGFRMLRTNHEELHRVNRLREKIELALEKAEDSLCPLTIQKKYLVKDNNIPFLYFLMTKLAHKEKNKQQEMKNPFMPPFQKGMMICELPPNHRLLFNKFNVFNNHLLVVTKEFRQQNERLSVQDFEQSALVMRALNGSFFYNCGENSGSSQKHKHIQLLPEESLNLPLMEKIRESKRKKQLKTLRKVQKGIYVELFTYSPFEFIHGIAPLSPPQKIKDFAYMLKNAEQSLFHYFKSVFGNKQFGYNLIVCQEFLMIVPRKKERFMEKIGLNSVGFMGSALIKDEKVFEKLQNLTKPIDILKEITFQEVQN